MFCVLSKLGDFLSSNPGSLKGDFEKILRWLFVSDCSNFIPESINGSSLSVGNEEFLVVDTRGQNPELKPVDLNSSRAFGSLFDDSGQSSFEKGEAFSSELGKVEKQG